MLNSRDLVDRQIIAAIREYKALSKRRYTIIKLDRPIQRGWRRLYALGPRASARPDSLILAAILEVIGPVVVHHSRDFRKSRGRRRKLVEIEQSLRPIPMYEWEQRNYPTAWRRYFRRELILERNRHWQPYWVFTQPSLYDLKIQRNWLWYFREIDPDVETRLSELDRWLDADERRHRHGWLKGRRQRYRWKEQMTEKERNLRREHQRDIKRALTDFPEVDLAAPTRRIPVNFRKFIRHFSRRSPMQRQRAQNSSSAGASPAAGTNFNYPPPNNLPRKEAPMNNQELRRRVRHELARVEAERNVRVLYACESGSRAWGFASRDSDYDVRFLYVHQRDWYLSVEDRRDVIERPLNDELDVSGWELRKALRLLRKSNPPLLEWLKSPMVYQEDSVFSAEFGALAEEFYSPRRCYAHYLHMAFGNWRHYLRDREQVSLKKYLYVFRPLLACRWIERGLGQPPMLFAELVERVLEEAEVRRALDALVARKQAGDELSVAPPDETLSRFIEAELPRLESLASPAEAAGSVEELNGFFRRYALAM